MQLLKSQSSESPFAYFAFIISIAVLAVMAVCAQAKAQTVVGPLTGDATRLGPVYAARSANVSSFLRIFNASAKAENVTVDLLSADGAGVLATWKSSVPAHASPQIAMAEIEAAAAPHLLPAEIPAQYLLAVTADGPAFAQHLVWVPAAGALSLASNCGARAVTASRFAINVHTPLIAGYPSAITVRNSAAVAQTAAFDVYDAKTGVRVAAYSVDVPANGSTRFAAAQFAQATGFSPDNIYQLNFALPASFPGTVSHSVTTLVTESVQDLSETCTLPGTSRDGLPGPILPATSYVYNDAQAGLPAYYTQANAPGSAAGIDNTPDDNPITDAGATLGRVLFYDRRLSVNNTVACASCHQQARGFSDAAPFSKGFAGGLTARHSMALGNARFYQRGRFFWDERAATLEAQVLQPIQNAVEMGMTLDELVTKVAATDFYPALFKAAFGSETVTSDRIARALAQFVRALSTSHSKFDQSLVQGGNRVLTAQEQQGLQLFRAGPNPNGIGNRGAGCARCHETNAHALDTPHNTGLDAVITDVGAGNGRFKAPSLRNAGVRGAYMHDGRFTTLAQVVEFYNSGIKANPNLDRILRDPQGNPQRLNLTPAEKAALVAFLETLTDTAFLSDARLSDPFRE